MSQKGINKAYSEMNNNRKKSKWLIGFIASAAILLLSIGLLSTPVVKASIQNALNVILADKFEKMEKGSQIPPQEVLVSVEENSKGILLKYFHDYTLNEIAITLDMLFLLLQILDENLEYLALLFLFCLYFF
ncbi:MULTISPECIES: hypothetical protein [Peribacillus]|uniref:hypothetical protein n=1 Tax=Peribacillus TaxID=2675229 RepID=UPI003017A5CB|nr:hypothetical protein KY492_07045 [Brevibacterium sp. PAMC21349]